VLAEGAVIDREPAIGLDVGARRGGEERAPSAASKSVREREAGRRAGARSGAGEGVGGAR